MTDYLHALPSGYRIEEYELVRVLGSGGFGITYLGYDHHLDKAVAIKEYLPNDLAVRTDNQSVLPKSTQDRADYEWGLERFLSEAQTLARFDHRHIIKIHRFFRAHGTGYIVMEYAEGETLSELLQRKGTLTEAELKAILFPILDGLEVVHEADFLHRDIKPGNIVIRDDGSPVLIDFGSARQAVAGKSRSVTAIVTPGYAPIEQYSAKGHQGPWTDIYALGAVCYRCLAGEPPDDVTERLREDPLIPATRRCKGKASKAFLEAIDRAMCMDEGQRPQSIAAWRKTLAGDDKSSKSAAKSEHRPEIWPADGSTTARTGMSRSSLALAFVIVVLLGASAWQGWQLYWGMPANDADEMITGVEQEADVTMDTTQAGDDARTALDKSGLGTEQEKLQKEESQPDAEDEITRLLAAAEQGDAGSQFILGDMYAKGERVSKDDAEAVRWYRMAAEQGDARAQFILGGMYFKGEGVSKDDAEAVRWFRMAAEQGDAGTQFLLGLMYDNGEGVPEDDAEAVRWYRMAAEQGHAVAQFNLGVMYDKGEGVPEDDAEAVRWYRMAAEQGHAAAQFNLGVMYNNGEGVPEDNAEAVRWYRKAAEQGDSGAQSHLGAMYVIGEGVPEDDVQAYAWLSIAVAQGNETAKELRNAIKDRMTPEQIAKAQDLSRVYWKDYVPDR